MTHARSWTGGLSVLGGVQLFQQRNAMPEERKGDLFPWGVSPSEHDRGRAQYSVDPTGRVDTFTPIDVFTPPSIWTDIRSLLVIIVSLVVIAGVIYEWWFFLPQRGDQPNTAPPNVPAAAPTTKPSSLLPFCPPERDECWR
jgi:hypothetical protein